MATTGPAPAARAASTTHASIGRPAIWWSTFARSLFIRVPRPAAMIRTTGDEVIVGNIARGVRVAAPRLVQPCGEPAPASAFLVGRDARDRRAGRTRLPARAGAGRRTG